ncbi:ROK family protein [Companilactobacillus bobalius]|uniref:Glucokinase n=2 Tax=Companilactobacillus bobalius TaxID=2801451 RepID=A0A202FDT0_9LACO|nr:ROK family protein [Companilactobacillus bobalius]KAE9556932.1 transcriptional regulator [Companilactobacillus bobalius]KRK81851.1 ROK protein [Companilactobacillus bobalius DSM 19674]OVE98582.1 Glucokinase [Companilactobacillus bobalius]GEO59006.1 transcriptional regulator [Companilactobacillus paralimentarius]
MSNYLSIDIGGTNLKYGILNNSGNLISHDKLQTPAKNIIEFTNAIFSIIDKYQSSIKGIAISVPGKIDDTGTIHHGGSLPFLDKVNLKKIIEDKYRIYTSIENDGKSAALAELWLGNLNNIDNSAAIVLGTGVGGGIVINGQLLYGEHFQAGEFSFMLNNFTKDDFLKAAVGANTSAVGMIKKIGSLKKLSNISDGIEVFNFINKKDPEAFPIFKEFCSYVAKLILNIQSVVDLKRFVIGGGISAQPIVTDTINEEYDKILNSTPIIKDSLTRPEILNAKFQNNANLYGALYGLLIKVDDKKDYIAQ